MITREAEHTIEMLIYDHGNAEVSPAVNYEGLTCWNVVFALIRKPVGTEVSTFGFGERACYSHIDAARQAFGRAS